MTPVDASIPKVMRHKTTRSPRKCWRLFCFSYTTKRLLNISNKLGKKGSAKTKRIKFQSYAIRTRCTNSLMGQALSRP